MTVLLKGFNEPQVIGNKRVTVVGPVARVGIVQSQMDHHHIGVEIERPGIFGSQHIRTVSLGEKRGPTVTEVPHHILFTQQFLQL